jgi:hypothetical protein
MWCAQLSHSSYGVCVRSPIAPKGVLPAPGILIAIVTA